MKRSSLCSVAALMAIFPTAAFAHPGGHAGGFANGFVHPLSGLDHVLAMIMVGIFAYQLGGRALWLVPAAFIAAMSLGGVFGLTGIGVPSVEIGIALSVIILGALVAANVRAPAIAAVAIVGFFAVFHGYAHGAEMPENASTLAYAAAFLIATAMLHLMGVALSFGIDKVGERYGSMLMRTAGAIGLIAGVGLFVGIL